MTERASLSNVSASHRAPRRQDPQQLSIQEACPHCASMQRLNDQYARLIDQLLKQKAELELVIQQFEARAA